ncbi:preprotein translocase subunit SecG [Acidocella sp.]|uniref:preprotein translocase subunit SecG n=1 Tax=Acidocella sp. TaxID=50710 RepID=UPI0026245C40|nr:preprotein translocase subunit SecG [Acidocella sp.]
MIKVLLVLHVFVTLALIGVILIQRSEGGLGLGGSQSMGGFMTGRGTANLLTRATAILGTAFFVLSLALALLYKGAGQSNNAAILNGPSAPPPAAAPASPAPLPQTPSGAQPAAPAAPPPPAPPGPANAPGTAQ